MMQVVSQHTLLQERMYGYGLIWTLIPSFIVLVVIQEMNARMGIVTGKGLSDLIRENAGLKITFFIFIGLLFSEYWKYNYRICRRCRQHGDLWC
jgi:hypothetical protein